MVNTLGKWGGLVLAISALGCGAGSAGMITVKGSDTMALLVSNWAEVFMESHPGTAVAVTGGGSGTGIKAFINGTTDMAMSSRDVSEEERKSASAIGRAMKETAVARDAVALVVNPANPVEELTLEQLRKIYTGQYARWSDVGGPDEPIVPYSRESSSGTFVFFQEHVLDKEDFASNVRLMPATAGIVQAVSSDRWAIGYVGLGHAAHAEGEVKILRIKADADAPAVMPSEESVRSGEYAIARPLFLITVESPPEPVQAFVDFALSDVGQKLVAQNDYIPVK